MSPTQVKSDSFADFVAQAGEHLPPIKPTPLAMPDLLRGRRQPPARCARCHRKRPVGYYASGGVVICGRCFGRHGFKLPPEVRRKWKMSEPA